MEGRESRMRSGGYSVTCLVLTRPRGDHWGEMFYTCTRGKIIASLLVERRNTILMSNN